MILGDRFRFRIGHVNDVVFINENSARPAELLPLRYKIAILVEDLNPIVIAIPDEKAPLRIESQAVRQVKLSGACSFFPPRLNEFTVPVKLYDAIVAVSAVSVCDKNIAIRSDCYSGRHVERVGTIPSNSRFAQSHQDFSIRAEF